MRLGYIPVAKWTVFCLKYLAGIDHKVTGLENIPSGQYIVGCNHQSAWETIVFSIILQNFAPVVKQQLMHKPIAGTYIRKLDCIPVDRDSPVKAIKTLLKGATEAFEAGKSILIFPNGTRASADEHVEYKSGIYAIYRKLGIPVIPAHVDSGKHWPRNAFRKIPGTIHLDFKPPIQPGLSKEEFFAEFEKRIEG
jgi:1-acyl-sn-glycerol-3-phosphate acyltransferase